MDPEWVTMTDRCAGKKLKWRILLQHTVIAHYFYNFNNFNNKGFYYFVLQALAKADQAKISADESSSKVGGALDTVNDILRQLGKYYQREWGLI